MLRTMRVQTQHSMSTESCIVQVNAPTGRCISELSAVHAEPWMQQAVVFDLDDTLSDTEHRSDLLEREPKDWRGYFAQAYADAPIKAMTELFALECDFANMLPGRCVHVWTGRGMEVMDATLDWLDLNVQTNSTYTLVMRATGDHRDHVELKRSLHARLTESGGHVLRAYDDSERMVRYWRENAVCCLQPKRSEY